MESVAYTTKSGAKQFRPKASYSEFSEGSLGFCLACGSEAYGVEPDACKYTCEGCGAPKVFGLEELVLMELAIVSGDDDEEDGDEG